MKNILLYGCFLITIVVHLIVVYCFLVSTIAVFFYFPWYIAVTIAVANVRVLTSRDRCLLTDLENKVRVKLGMNAIRGFVSYYVLNPVYKFITKRNS